VTQQERIVEVSFILPGHGAIVERYDMLDPNHRACWSANAKCYMQTGVKPVGFVDVPEHRKAAWYRLLRRRGNAGKRMGLALRQNAGGAL